MAAAKKTAKTAANAEEFIADAQKTIEESTAKFGKGVEEMTAFGQETLDAMMKSSEIAAKAAEELHADVAAFSKKSFDDTVAAAKDLASVSSPTELFEKQAAFATAALEGFMSQAAKWNESMGSATKEAIAPIGARVNAAGDLVKSYTV